MKKSHIVLLLTSSLLLSACAVTPDSYGYRSYRGEGDGYYQATRIQYGVVSSVRELYTETSPTNGSGAVLGAIIGGVAGHQLGGGRGRDVATVAGALIGGAIGDNVERDGRGPSRRLSGFDMTIRLDSGELLRVTQPANQVFSSGNRVRVEINGNQARVNRINY